MEKEKFNVPKEEIEDFTGNGPWEIKGEVYKYVDEFITHGDGEWTAVIVQRQSDKKYFRFDWGYYHDNYHYEEGWKEVKPRKTIKTKWE